jgi:hypothetical protein
MIIMQLLVPALTMMIISSILWELLGSLVNEKLVRWHQFTKANLSILIEGKRKDNEWEIILVWLIAKTRDLWRYNLTKNIYSNKLHRQRHSL